MTDDPTPHVPDRNSPDPDVPTPPDADRAWFRSHLDPIVGGPSPSRFDDLADRLTGTGPEPVAATTAGRRHQATLVVGAAAAVAVLVVAVAVVVRPWTDDDPPAVVATGEPDPTGWYVPVGLPDGWTLEAIEAYRGHPTCERRGFQWSDPRGGRSIGLDHDACREPRSDDGMASPEDIGMSFPMSEDLFPGVVEVDLGGGVTGFGLALGGELRTESESPFRPARRMLSWEDGSGTWTLSTLGLDEEELIAAARTFATDPDQADPSVVDHLDQAGDLRLVERWTAPARDRRPEVELGLTAPDGRRIGLQLNLPGDARRAAGTSPVVPEAIEGQPNPVWFYDDPSWAGRFGGAWPGADLTVYRWAEHESGWDHDTQIRTLLASLRPASAEQWQAYVDTATRPVPDAVRTAPTLAALYAEGDGPEAPPAPPESEDPSTPVDPAAEEGATTTSIAAPSPDALVSGPGIILPPPERSSSFSDLTGLDVRLEVDEATVRSGERLGARLRWTNTTDTEIVVNECTSLLMPSGLVPAEDPDGPLPIRAINDCYNTPTVTVPPGETVTSELDDGLVARRPREGPSVFVGSPWAGTLDAGIHLAVVNVWGRTSSLRIELPITVTEPHCPTTDADVERYVGRTEAQARSLADRAGDTIRIVAIDGRPQAVTYDLRCERVNLDLRGDQVWDALRH